LWQSLNQDYAIKLAALPLILVLNHDHHISIEAESEIILKIPAGISIY